MRLWSAVLTGGTVLWLLASAALLRPVFWLLRPGRKWAFAFFRMQSRAVYLGLRPLTGAVEIRRETECSQPCIYVANHPSALDPFVFFRWTGPAVFFSKAWPFRLPFYGFYLRRIGQINGEGLTLEALCEAVRERLAAGVSVVFFPEGTRRARLGRFHSLAFHVAVRLGAPVTPVAIAGHAQLLPPGGRLPRPARIAYTVFAPMESAPFAAAADGPLRMAQQARATIARALAFHGENS